LKYRLYKDLIPKEQTLFMPIQKPESIIVRLINSKPPEFKQVPTEWRYPYEQVRIR
jgi:hypothetical protein